MLLDLESRPRAVMMSDNGCEAVHSFVWVRVVNTDPVTPQLASACRLQWRSLWLQVSLKEKRLGFR